MKKTEVDGGGFESFKKPHISNKQLHQPYPQDFSTKTNHLRRSRPSSPHNTTTLLDSNDTKNCQSKDFQLPRLRLENIIESQHQKSSSPKRLEMVELQDPTKSGENGRVGEFVD